MAFLTGVLQDQGWVYTWTEVGGQSLTRAFLRRGDSVVIVVKAGE